MNAPVPDSPHQPYTLLQNPGPDEVRFVFRGPFEGRDIRWDTTLRTLSRDHALQPAGRAAIPRSAYIEIEGETGHGQALTIALDIPAIDAGVILRSIIMIRQYRRLRAGRHEFGQPRVFPP